MSLTPCPSVTPVLKIFVVRIHEPDLTNPEFP